MLVAQTEFWFRLLVEKGDEPCSGCADVGGSRQIAEDFLKSAAKMQAGKISHQGKKGSEAEASKDAVLAHEKGDVANSVQYGSDDKDDKLQPAHAQFKRIGTRSHDRKSAMTIGPIGSVP